MNQININLSLDDSFNNPNNRIDDEFIATGLTINQRTYIEIKQFSRMYNMSDSTVRRLLRKVEHRRSREFSIKLENKIFVSPSITMLTKENFSKMDDINGNWEVFLRGFEWDYFGCVSFKWSITQATAKERMTKFFDKLSNKFKSAEIRMFYVCEENNTRDGYHTHFILWSDITDKAEVKRFMENHFRGNGKEPFANTRIDKYDPNDGGIGYMLKEVSKNPDGYDYLYKNKP